MKHFLVVLHDSIIARYLVLAIQNTASLDESCVWLTIDSNMQPLKPKKWSKLELALTKRNPIFKRNPFDELHVNELIKKNENVKWLEGSDKIVVDWILLEDASIDVTNYEKRTKKGFVALQYSAEKIIFESIKKESISMSYLFKSPTESTWNKYNKLIGFEKGLKNNCDKVLWNFSIFLPKLLFMDFKTDPNEATDLKTKDSNVTKVAILCYQLLMIGESLKRKLPSKHLNWKIAFEKESELIFLKQPAKSFWADPFFIEHEGLKVVFFEELDGNGKGIISAVTIDDCFEIIEKQVIIDESFHLSFPNVFIQNNQLYMIPESIAGNKVLVYQCDLFPFNWSLKQTVIDNLKILDMVWTKQDNIYWIFANKVEDFEYDNNERLYLYSTNDLFYGKWESHALNPIVCNKKTARNAGKIINSRGKIIRVSQNCDKSYGSNLVFNEIETLTLSNYEEKPIKTVHLSYPYFGQHTWNEAFNHYAVTDFLIKE
jgi:hypothetical protein